MAANVNRWRDQMGQPDLSAAELDALPKIDMFGVRASLVEIDGVYTGMGDELKTEAKMLGTVALLGQTSVFVKMTGPREQVAAERDRFIAFCESLREDR